MYVCTRLNVGVELKGHSPACSLDWSSAGSHQAHQAPHPPSHAFPSHFSLCSSLLTPSFPMNQLFPFAQAGFSMHLSSVIKNVSSPPPCSMLDWRSPSQAQQGTGCPQIRPTILTWKGATSGEWRTVGVEAHVCMCLPIFICKYRFVVSAWWLCVSVQWVLGVSGVWYLWKCVKVFATLPRVFSEMSCECLCERRGKSDRKINSRDSASSVFSSSVLPVPHSNGIASRVRIGQDIFRQII